MSKRTDFIILVALLSVAVVIMVASTGLVNVFGDSTFPIYDTYLVLPTYKIGILLASFLTIVSFLGKQLITNFKSVFGSYILIIATCVLILILPEIAYHLWVIQLLANAGWDIDGATALPGRNSLFLLPNIILLSTLIVSTYKLAVKK